MPDEQQPMQPIALVEGVARFKTNEIVRRLFDLKLINLNDIALWADVPIEDREQFWQMLGYSVSAYGGLSFVRREIASAASAKVMALLAERGDPPMTAWERLLEESEIDPLIPRR